jgi:hypothetical protein
VSGNWWEDGMTRWGPQGVPSLTLCLLVYKANEYINMIR